LNRYAPPFKYRASTLLKTLFKDVDAEVSLGSGMLRFSTKTIMESLLNTVDEETRKIIESLSEDERKVFEYFVINVSVGSIAALRELSTIYKIRNPRDIIRRLIELGLLEQGSGCYSLSKKLRDALLECFRKRLF